MADKNKRDVEEILYYQKGGVAEEQHYNESRTVPFYRPESEVSSFFNVISIGISPHLTNEDIKEYIKDLIRADCHDPILYFGGDVKPYIIQSADPAIDEIDKVLDEILAADDNKDD